MLESETASHLEEDISIHIFTVSASLVGVCLTVIGIVHIVIGMRTINTLADDLLALDAFVFLCSCLLSYWALRTRSKRRMHQVERIADAIFIFGLLIMVVVCGLIVYVLA
jgi:heme/copper-type cytochrome/quinol oxidase subunit 2